MLKIDDVKEMKEHVKGMYGRKEWRSMLNKIHDVLRLINNAIRFSNILCFYGYFTQQILNVEYEWSVWLDDWW